MRRIAGGFPSHRRRAIGRGLATGAFALASALASAFAGDGDGDGDGPELLPPVGAPIVSTPLNPAPAPTPTPAPSPAPRSRAVLAIPGVTSRVARPAVPLEGPKPIPGPGQAPETNELSLDGPIEMKPLPEALPGRPGTGGSRSDLPLILEPSPLDDPGPLGGSSTRGESLPKKPAERAQQVTPARRPRLFGFLAGPVASRAAAPSPAPGRSEAVDEPEDAEAALKRRIERQARDAVGNRARSLEVRVDGKSAVVHASGVKLFQKRAVRKQLEGIPALAGLRSTIEVGD